MLKVALPVSQMTGCDVLFPHAVISLPAQRLNSYIGQAHDWKDLVKVGPNMTKAILTGEI